MSEQWWDAASGHGGAGGGSGVQVQYSMSNTRGRRVRPGREEAAGSGVQVQSIERTVRGRRVQPRAPRPRLGPASRLPSNTAAPRLDCRRRPKCPWRRRRRRQQLLRASTSFEAAPCREAAEESGELCWCRLQATTPDLFRLPVRCKSLP